NKGLRHFSMKVCERVQKRGTTSYNEVADDVSCYKRDSKGKPKRSSDEKNIRRRVYDALNVLHALEVISKDKKGITWLGMPNNEKERIKKLKEEKTKREADIKKKKECLQELMSQNVCFNNLFERNNASLEALIPLPFIVVNTNSKAVIQCEMCPERTNVSFDFSLPYEINDDNEILKRLGM
ncbi:hypothetical protein THAPSDRAFT_261479, partial [Thalassiosira pseudonana CCMP1335]